MSDDEVVSDDEQNHTNTNTPAHTTAIPKARTRGGVRITQQGDQQPTTVNNDTNSESDEEPNLRQFRSLDWKLHEISG